MNLAGHKRRFEDLTEYLGAQDILRGSLRVNRAPPIKHNRPISKLHAQRKIMSNQRDPDPSGGEFLETLHRVELVPGVHRRGRFVGQ